MSGANGKSAIAKAITSAAAKRKAETIHPSQVPIAATPIVMKPGSHLGVTKAVDTDPQFANLLLYDPAVNAYRAVLLPNGTKWELVPEGPQLWRPGMPT